VKGEREGVVIAPARPLAGGPLPTQGDVRISCRAHPKPWRRRVILDTGSCPAQALIGNPVKQSLSMGERARVRVTPSCHPRGSGGPVTCRYSQKVAR